MEHVTLENTTCLLTGASGFVGKIIYPILKHAFSRVVGLCYSNTTHTAFLPVNLFNRGDLTRTLRTYSPRVIIHSAALRDPDACEATPEIAHSLHIDATEECAEWATANNAILVYISTDYVFDGEHPPYSEDDPTSPLSVYGRTKLRGELAARECPEHIIARIPLQYGYSTLDDDAFLLKSLAQLNRGGEIKCDNSQPRYPTLSDDIGYALCDILRTAFTGTLHISASSRKTRFDMMNEIADVFSYPHAKIIPCKNAHTSRAPRPKDSQLDTSTYSSFAWHHLNSFYDGLNICLHKMKKDDCDWYSL
jgi:S-adenosylmethionine synthetase